MSYLNSSVSPGDSPATPVSTATLPVLCKVTAVATKSKGSPRSTTGTSGISGGTSRGSRGTQPPVTTGRPSVMVRSSPVVGLSTAPPA